MEARALENISFRMPWQLSEELYKAKAAGLSHRIAEVGLRALAYETHTNYYDKSLDYIEVWKDALRIYKDLGMLIT